MAKVHKSFKLSLAAIECIKKIQEHGQKNGNKLTQTDVLEQALYSYLVSIYGESELSRIILNNGKN